MLRQENNLINKAMEQTEPVLEGVAKDSEDARRRQEAHDNLELLKHSKSYLDWTLRLANAMESGDIFNHYPKK